MVCKGMCMNKKYLDLASLVSRLDAGKRCKLTSANASFHDKGTC